MKSQSIGLLLVFVLVVNVGFVLAEYGTGAKKSETKTSEAKTDDERARLAEYRNDAQKIISESKEAYNKIVKRTPGVPQNVLSQAKCVAVFPNVVTAAVVVGGTKGTGVVSCRSSDGWTAPVYYSLQGGSIGAQVGGKSRDLVLFMITDEAAKAIKRGKFEIGADASVVAGTYDQSFETGASGVVAYEHAEGAFAGASITGVNLSRDEETTRQYYGQEIDYTALLEGRGAQMANERGKEFSAILPG